MSRKKRICVVTWGGSNNYGTVLQGLALVQTIKTMGYEVFFYSKYQKFKRSYRYYIKKFLIYIGFKCLEDDVTKKYKLIDEFRKRYHNEVSFKNQKDLQKFINTIDVFVTGSDQIWNTYFRYDPFYFLDFVGNHKRIAYSSSIGTDSVKEEYKSVVRSHLMKFAHIGVREGEAVKVLSQLTGRFDIKHVLDPVYLVTAEQWSFYANQAPNAKKFITGKYIMCYFVGSHEEYHKQLEVVKAAYGIDTVINVSAHYYPHFLHSGTVLYNEGHPFDFIYFIKYASVICTDSFHAISFSLILSKDFVLFKRFADNDKASQNSRVFEILNHFGVAYKLFSNKDQKWQKRIDYNNVQKTLDRDRKECLDFLKNSIEN